MTRILFLFGFWIFICRTGIAQENNPFQSIGKNGKILTLTNGKYEELFDQQDVQQIGTALVNIRTNKVIQLLSEKEAENRLDNTTTSRFLSIDPLTNAYPMLTPYQYASNRPIDGIDLDGKEWTKVETYNPKTGVTNIHFQVKLKIVNQSTVFNDAQNLKSEIQKQFTEAFNDIKSKDAKTTYSGSISPEFVNDYGEHDYGADITEGKEHKPGSISISGISSGVDTKENSVSANGSKYLNGKLVPRSTSVVVQDLIHELIHTGGVYHPMDDINTAEDVDLVPSFGPDGKFVTYRVGEKATFKEIISNIMIYDFIKVEGKKVKEWQPDASQQNKVSADQSQIISNQIDIDKNKKRRD